VSDDSLFIVVTAISALPNDVEALKALVLTGPTNSTRRGSVAGCDTATTVFVVPKSSPMTLDEEAAGMLT
jgi:hypothetical protein